MLLTTIITATEKKPTNQK